MKRSELVETLDRLAIEPNLSEQGRRDVQNAAGVVRHWTVPDTKVYRIVVWVLGIVALMTVAGGIALAFMPQAELPQAVVAIGATAVGALAGLLAPSPSGGG